MSLTTNSRQGSAWVHLILDVPISSKWKVHGYGPIILLGLFTTHLWLLFKFTIVLYRWDHFNKMYLKRVLLRDYHEIEEQSNILKIAAQLNEDEAIEYIQKHGALPNTASSNDLAGQNSGL